MFGKKGAIHKMLVGIKGSKKSYLGLKGRLSPDSSSVDGVIYPVSAQGGLAKSVGSLEKK